MAPKRSKKAPKKVKSLRAKSVGASQSKGVRGGLNPQPLPPRWAPPEHKGDPINKI
jgi:hypothetical protein